MQLSRYLVNFIILFFQLTSRLCLTSQLWPKNIFTPFKSVTAASSCSLCLSISISRGTTLVTSLFFILSVLKTLNKKFISLVCIYFSLTNCLLIPIYMHSEFTSALILRFFLFFVFTFACMFNSLSILLHQFGITYLFWEFTEEISCTIPTWDLLQNPISSFLFYHLHYHSIPLESFISLLTISLYSSWQYVLLCCIWNIFMFPSLSSLSNILLLYVHTCCSWSTLASYPWSCCYSFQCP